MKLSNKNTLAVKRNYNHNLPIKKCRYFIIIFFILCVVFNYAAEAQYLNPLLAKKNQFTVGLGTSYLQTVDFQFSLNIYQGVRNQLHLGYSNKLKRGIFATHFNMFGGTLMPLSGTTLEIYAKETDFYGVETNESIKLELSQMGVNIEIGYLHKLPSPATTRTTFYVGSSLEENLTFTPGFLSIGTINYASLNVKTRLDYILKNGKPLIFQLDIPAVSVVTRMPYHNSPNIPGKSGLAGFFTGNNDIKTLEHFQNPRFLVKYPLLVRKRVALDISYQGSWLHYYKPENLTHTASQLSIGLNF